jgi:hypothetical protein
MTDLKLKIANILSKWLSEPWKMTESRKVVTMRGPSARSEPRQLDRDTAWTTWRKVNAGDLQFWSAISYCDDHPLKNDRPKYQSFTILVNHFILSIYFSLEWLTKITK